MKFRKIKLKNFRQFYGEQEIEFSINNQKNVTLIHAENGTGKTAFLNAILWCFFEITTSNFKDPKTLLNKVAKSEGKKSYGVFIEFEDDSGAIFDAHRSFSNSGNSFRVFEIIEGAHRQVDNPNSFINSVIPKDMAKYFFFQGEGIGKVSGSKGDSVVKTAVREILGFTIAEMAIDDLRKIKSEYRKQLNAADKSGEISRLNRDIEDLEIKITKAESDIEKFSSSISFYDDKLYKIEELLSNSKSDVIKQVHKRRKAVELSLTREQKRLADAKTEKRLLVSEFATTVFGYKLSGLALDFIDEAEYKGTVPAPYNEQLVSDILKESICICGSDIKPGTDAFNKIRAMLKKAADPMLENRIRKSRSQLTAIQNDSRRAKGRFTRNMEAMADSENVISELKKELEDLSVQIKGAESIDDIERLEADRHVAKNNLAQEERAHERTSVNLESANELIVKRKKELSKLDSFSGEVSKLSSLIHYTDKVADAISETLKRSEKDVEIQVIQKVNKYLEKFVRQDYKAKLHPNTFEIRLVDRNDYLIPESDGQALLLSLTFISSLIELSRERKNAQGQILTPGAIAPFVVDAPFGDLDNKYKGHVAKAIPNSVEQVIFLLSSSHWEGTVEENIRDRVGMEYNMVLEETSDNANKSEDSIVIMGTKYATVRYGSSVDRTIMEKVAKYV